MVVGKVLDEHGDHWKVNCPVCDKEIEYKGWFDSGEVNECTCGHVFKTDRIEFPNGDYID